MAMSKDTSEIHPGVAMLLARMESHPEEFAGLDMRSNDTHTTAGYTKWARTLRTYWGVLTVEEQNLIHDALHITNRKNFYSELMSELVNPRETYLINTGLKDAKAISTTYSTYAQLNLDFTK